jgi:hypothetical protein
MDQHDQILLRCTGGSSTGFTATGAGLGPQPMMNNRKPHSIAADPPNMPPSCSCHLEGAQVFRHDGCQI